MPNFTINRKLEDSDVYGCNCFSTNQNTGQIAGDDSPLDGTIIWYIDADPGYVVSVADFDIPNTTPTSVSQPPGYKTFQGSGIPYPILGVVMEQSTATRIIVTLYLFPTSTHGIGGNAFVMPNHNVATMLDIIGCAEEAGEQATIKVVHQVEGEGKQECNTSVNIASAFSSVLSEQVESSHITNVVGFLNSGDNDVVLFTYTVSAPAGQRFPFTPTISINTNQYYYTENITYDNDGNMISVVFSIYRGVQPVSTLGVNSPYNNPGTPIVNNSTTVA